MPNEDQDFVDRVDQLQRYPAPDLLKDLAGDIFLLKPYKDQELIKELGLLLKDHFGELLISLRKDRSSFLELVEQFESIISEYDDQYTKLLKDLREFAFSHELLKENP